MISVRLLVFRTVVIALLAAGGISGCATVSGHSASKVQVVPVAARSHHTIPASKYRHAVVPKVPPGDIGYPDDGVILAPPLAGPAPHVSAVAVLRSFKKQILVRDVLGHAISSTPTLSLKLVTENQPTYPGLRPGVRYNGWVVKYTGVKPISYGNAPVSRNTTLRCAFIGIYDLELSAWTTFFLNCPG